MALKSLCLAAVLLLATGNSLFAEDLDIQKFEEVKVGKAAPARIVYLEADGTEGRQGESGAVPAIKMYLFPMPKTASVGIELLAQMDHLVMQDITPATTIKEGRIGVEVWASSDFKRVPNQDAHSKFGDGDFEGYPRALPDMDFWIIGPHHSFLSYLTPGQWTHVEGKFQISKGAHFEFHVPPGTGYIYLKDFVAKR